MCWSIKCSYWDDIWIGADHHNGQLLEAILLVSASIASSIHFLDWLFGMKIPTKGSFLFLTIYINISTFMLDLLRFVSCHESSLHCRHHYGVSCREPSRLLASDLVWRKSCYYSVSWTEHCFLEASWKWHIGFNERFQSIKILHYYFVWSCTVG